jgi:hypothetical protein
LFLLAKKKKKNLFGFLKMKKIVQAVRLSSTDDSASVSNSRDHYGNDGSASLSPRSPTDMDLTEVERMLQKKKKKNAKKKL